MAGMPVSTLRIWEQRYRAVGTTTAPSGHRLYSAADVERVMLLRRLTGYGHAIGSLAKLDTEQLRGMVLAQATEEVQSNTDLPWRRAPMKIIVVGQAMARRLERPSFRYRGTNSPQIVGVFDSLADAAQAATDSSVAEIDLLLWQASGLQVDVLPDLQAAQNAWSAPSVAVTYRFSGTAARNELASAGVIAVTEPADDEALATWLSSLEPPLIGGTGHRSKTAERLVTDSWTAGAMGLLQFAPPARRFDDAILTEFAGLSSRIACECPRHVTELLLQISSFETYSANCSNRSPADAELHDHLQRVAGAARMLFETALERIAVAEGWRLP